MHDVAWTAARADEDGETAHTALAVSLLMQSTRGECLSAGLWCWKCVPSAKDDVVRVEGLLMDTKWCVLHGVCNGLERKSATCIV